MFGFEIRKERKKIEKICPKFFFLDPPIFELLGDLGVFWGHLQSTAVTVLIIIAPKSKKILKVQINSFLLMCWVIIFGAKKLGGPLPQNFGASRGSKSKISNGKLC